MNSYSRLWIYAILVAALLLIAVLTTYASKVATYHVVYEHKVRATIREMVRQEALK